MALQINKEINDTTGRVVASGAYVRITQVRKIADIDSITLFTETFTNEQARRDNLRPLELVEFPNEIEIPITNAELASDNIFIIVYSRLKNYLQDILGNNIEDLI